MRYLMGIVGRAVSAGIASMGRGAAALPAGNYLVFDTDVYWDIGNGDLMVTGA